VSTSASKFLFDCDFGAPSGGSAKTIVAVKEAETRGYARGVEDGRRQGVAEADAQLTAAIRRLAESAAALLAGLDAYQGRLEEEALAFGSALARKLAGTALAAQPLEPILEAARSAFQHLRGVPHLVVRVNEALVEAVEAQVQRIARERGYEGRLVVIGEPDISPGDGRIEWADGGVVREQGRIEAAVAGALAGIPGAGR
jgi:flagellar assembly protein FliH